MTTGSPPRGSEGTGRWLAVALSLVQFYGLIGFAVATLIQLIQHGSDGLAAASLINALVWLIGVNGIVTASGHLLFPKPVADSIGWPSGTPWQWEVGLTSLGLGVCGVISPMFDRPFWLATILIASIFLLGAAVGHVREVVVEKNWSPGNAGAILYTDVLIPVLVLTLYVIT